MGSSNCFQQAFFLNKIYIGIHQTENPDVFDFGFEIVGYNGENNCTARVILTDYDYVDIIELTAEIDIKEQKVINAEIIELQ